MKNFKTLIISIILIYIFTASVLLCACNTDKNLPNDEILNSENRSTIELLNKYDEEFFQEKSIIVLFGGRPSSKHNSNKRQRN